MFLQIIVQCKLIFLAHEMKFLFFYENWLFCYQTGQWLSECFCMNENLLSQGKKKKKIRAFNKAS